MAEAAAPAPISRREFLQYIWASSLLLAIGGTTGGILWFAYPRFREGEFGGTFTVPIGSLPAPGSPPQENAEGRFWLVNTGSGVLAIYKVCTHLGCLYKWAPLNNRFECPCHGSKFEADGTYIEGPAPRNLDRFVLQVVDSSGEVLGETPEGDPNQDPQAGGPVAVAPGATAIRINTGSIVQGAGLG